MYLIYLMHKCIGWIINVFLLLPWCDRKRWPARVSKEGRKKQQYYVKTVWGCVHNTVKIIYVDAVYYGN